MLRFLVASLMSDIEDFEKQPFEQTRELAQTGVAALAVDWARREGGDSTATLELLASMRSGKLEEAIAIAHRQIVDSKVPAGAIWDAVFLAAGEFMYRHRHGGYASHQGLNTSPLHSNTVANAMYYAFTDAHMPRNRLLIVLQAVAWVTDFIGREGSRDNLRDLNILDLGEEDLPDDSSAAIDAIFSTLPSREQGQEISDRSSHDLAARRAFTYGRKGMELEPFARKACDFLRRKANSNAHDYKFPVAIFENYNAVNPQWRPFILAASVQWLHGDETPDSPVFQRLSERILKIPSE